MKTCYVSLLLVLLALLPRSGYTQQLSQEYRVKVAGIAFHRLTVDSEGNTFVYGHFDDLGGTDQGRLVKLDPSGNLVTSFNKLYMDDAIMKMVMQPDKKILICGPFSKINDVPVNSLVRLNADGTLDNTFSCPLTSVNNIALQSTGKIIALTGQGTFERINTDGSIDATFNFSNFVFSFSDIAIAPDNSIYFHNLDMAHKLTPDGEDDPNFTLGAGADGQLSALTVQSDGKVLVGGFFTKYNGVNSKSIVRLTSSGEVDNTFVIGTGPDGQIFKIVERANHSILIGGQFTQFNGQPASLVELNPNGTLSRNIAVVSINWLTNIADNPNGKITIGGDFQLVNGQSVFGTCRFNSNYTIDASFKPAITYNNANGRHLLVRDDLSAIITSSSDTKGIFNGSTYINGRVVEVNPLGVHKPSFVSYFTDGSVYGHHLQSDGKLLLSGFINFSASIVRLNTDGTKDNSFDVGGGVTNNGSATPVDLITESDDMILLGGTFTHFNGTPSIGLVGINGAGVLQKAFTSLPTGSHVWRAKRQSNGKLVLIGTFPFAAGTKYITRLNADGSLDNSFYQVSMQTNASDLAIDSEDNIYLAGDHLHPDGSLLKSIIKLEADGAVDGTFNLGSGFSQNSYIIAIEVLPGDKIAVGGYFNTVQGVDQSGFAILEKNGNRAPIPEFFFGKGSFVVEMDYKRGQLFLTGRFRSPDFKASYGVAKIVIEPIAVPVAPADLNVSLHSPAKFLITWTDASANELAFVLERAEDDFTSFYPIDTLGVGVTLKIDNIEMDKNYAYRVRALNEGGYSAYSNVDFLTWSPVPEGVVSLTIPTPTSAQASLTLGGSIVYHTGYSIERSVDSETDFVVLDTIAQTATTFQDVIEIEKQYRYRVKAFNKNGSVSSAVVLAAWRPAPAGSIAASISSTVPGEAILSWTHSISYHLGFIITRSTLPASEFVPIDTVASGVSTFTDVTDGNQRYYYQVVAYNANGTLASNTIAMLVTDVEQYAGHELQTYPNPIAHTIYVNASDVAFTSGKWRLTSTTGQSLELTAFRSDGIFELDVRNISRGIFVLQYISDDGKRWHKKIVKH